MLSWRSLVGAAAVAGTLAVPAVASASPSDALVLGEPDSPVLDVLREQTDLGLVDRNSPGKADPDDFGMLIVDGDQQSPDELTSRQAIENFAAADRWVVAFDLARRQIGALDAYTGFAVADRPSDMVMFRVGTAQGSPMIDVVDGGPPGLDSARDLTDTEQRRMRGYEVRGAAALVVGRTQIDPESAAENLRELGEQTKKVPCGTLSPTPLPGLLHIGWCYTSVGSAAPPNGKFDDEFWWIDKYPGPGSQTANWTLNHRFDVFLDNDPVTGSAKGNFEIVDYALNGEIAPKRDTEKFFRMYDAFHSGWNSFAHDVVVERAWWTGRAEPSIRPDATTRNLLTREDSQPQSANDEVSFSSSDSFSVGFSGTAARPDAGLGIGVQLGWTSEKGKSYTVPSWGVQNKSSGKDAAWSFSSLQPCNTTPEGEGKNLKDTCFVDDGVGRHGPAEPNRISRTNLQIRASARWRTDKPLKAGAAPLTMALGAPIRLFDTYCSTGWNGGVGFCPYGITSGYGMEGWTTGPKAATAQIEADWVEPVGIDSIDLSTKHADGDKNERVTGTVTLKRAPKVPVDVQVIAANPNAKLAQPFPGVTDGSQTTVRIDPGQIKGTFTIYTNANKLSKGESSTALITAFYAEATDPVELKVFRPE